MKANSKSYLEIKDYLEVIPVIETHDHFTGIGEPVNDILDFLLNNYYISDLVSGSFGMEKEASSICGFMSHPKDKNISFEERFKVFDKLYRRSDKTAYAKGLQIGMKKCWGVEKINDLASLRELNERFTSRNQEFYNKTMDACGIKAKVVDVFDIRPYVNGSQKEYSKYCRFAFPLPQFHRIHSRDNIDQLGEYADGRITCLDEYIESFEKLLKKAVDFGIVCFKDQSAYWRAIDYSLPSRGEAEKIFNKIAINPRSFFGDEEVRMLDDWLFQHFMRLAKKYDLPVQFHTGHLAGIRNDITNTNAIRLTPLLELQQDVRFDLFHGNWPYMDEFLFLGKNYPNVWLDLCWVQLIDPLYSVELMKRALVTVPHVKILAFGADTSQIEWVVGYLEIARENVAYALSDMVDSGWINVQEAKEIAADWFFNNPNELYKLGFERFGD